ncbi:MAG TPA: hypothetical protein VI112_14920 [Bacteroidia bacterium]|jgi:hypothetical protein
MKRNLVIAFSLLVSAWIRADETYLGKHSLYHHLVNINGNWSRYIKEEGAWAVQVSFPDDQSLISTDLILVEQFLRGRDVSGLSAELLEARERNLDEFHVYIMAGNFPVNYDHEERRPCFIDRDGGVCAVGNLLVRSGEKKLAYYLAQQNLYDYVKDMNVSELAEWQKRSGLSPEELALIQPTYDGWGRRSGSNRKNYGVQLGFIYGQDLFAFNTSKDIFSFRPEAYRHLYSFFYGLSATANAASGKFFLESGVFSLSDKYVYQVEGVFGTQGQYGKIFSLLNPHYISVPVSIGFTGGNYNYHTAFKIGYRGDIFNSLENTVIAFGSPTPQDIMMYTLFPADFNKLRSNLVVSGVWDYYIGDKHSVRFHLEPSLVISLTPAQKGETVMPYQPVRFGFNTGIVYAVPYDKQKHLKRKQTREKRKADRKQRKEMKKQQKENEEKKKEQGG